MLLLLQVPCLRRTLAISRMIFSLSTADVKNIVGLLHSIGEDSWAKMFFGAQDHAFLPFSLNNNVEQYVFRILRSKRILKENLELCQQALIAYFWRIFVTYLFCFWFPELSPTLHSPSFCSKSRKNPSLAHNERARLVHQNISRTWKLIHSKFH